mgnify:CR=1 FL=1
MMPNLEQDLSLQKHLYNAVYEPTQVIDITRTQTTQQRLDL